MLVLPNTARSAAAAADCQLSRFASGHVAHHHLEGRRGGGRSPGPPSGATRYLRVLLRWRLRLTLLLLLLRPVSLVIVLLLFFLSSSLLLFHLTFLVWVRFLHHNRAGFQEVHGQNLLPFCASCPTFIPPSGGAFRGGCDSISLVNGGGGTATIANPERLLLLQFFVLSPFLLSLPPPPPFFLSSWSCVAAPAPLAAGLRCSRPLREDRPVSAHAWPQRGSAAAGAVQSIHPFNVLPR